MPFVVGENVGPYRIMEQLGRGGMATVFKAYHAALDRYVAIKALHPAFMEDPNFLARFQREARVVAKLEHPNIVPIYDFAEYEDRPYLVMKFIEGETLKARLVRDGIPDDQIVVIVKAVGEALTYAHGQGILHRDVKPSNVLLANDNRIYLADFGLARIAQAGESTLSGDMMLGTPQYISPEQAMGAQELDEGTDIYSFGVMLYELVVGQVPFSADTPFSIIHDHIYTPLPMPQQINDSVPESIERVLLKALAKERADRYDDISSLVDAFRKSLSETETLTGVVPTEAPPSVIDPTILGKKIAESRPAAVEAAPQRRQRKPKKERKRRLRWWQIALIAIASVFCCLIALAIINENRPQPEGGLATQPAVLDVVPDDSTVVDTSEALSAARDKVAENPSDPQAQIELGIASLESNQLRVAVEAFDKAIELSNSSFDTLLKVADTYHKNEVWIHATQTYLIVAKIYPEQMDAQILNRFQESGFMAAGTEIAEEKIPIEAVKEVDELFEQVLKARNRLFVADPAQAQEILDGVFAQFPEFPPAQLVQAEIHFANDQTDLAREFVEGLMSKDTTPFWIKEYIRSTVYSRSAIDTRADLPSLEDAKIAVLQNPDDPWLRLDLVEAMLHEEAYDGIEPELAKALELANYNPDIFIQAGDIFMRHNIYGLAAAMYILSENHDTQTMSEETYQKLAKSLFLASGNKESIRDVTEYEADIDPFLVEISRIRYALHFEDREQALTDVTALKESYPDAPEVLLLEAEILFNLGAEGTALEQLERLTKDDGIPDWVARQAEIFLKKFTQ